MSLFSGIGGLEHSTVRPEFYCESDEAARHILTAQHPGAVIHDDVRGLRAVPVDCVVGGWPCQDLTVAGKMKGIHATRSGLFFEMVGYANRCGAATFIGENVPNLLRNRRGEDFRVVLTSLAEAGYGWIAWRTLDAREFGLPQSRRRVIIVASREREVAFRLHRPIRARDRCKVSDENETRVRKTYGFYWTGGLGRSLCLAEGVVPALKVGSSTSKGTSPVAVFIDGAVRKLSAEAGLRLQGFFRTEAFSGQIEGDVFRMAGNAVPRPIGSFALGSATLSREAEVDLHPSLTVSPSGLFDGSNLFRVDHEPVFDYAALQTFVDDDCRLLSPQASAGLLARVIRAGRPLPTEVFDALYARSRTRTRLIGTKVNSFEILDSTLDALGYREWISMPTRAASNA